MAIKAFFARPQAEVVTFAARQITFSVPLIERYGLEDFEFARIGVDPELRRIYFSFQKEPAPGLPKFFRQRGKSKRKMIAIGGLYAEYDWIGALKHEKERARRQFILEEVDPKQEDIYPEYKFFVTIGYSWAADRDFQDPTQYPEEPGVYRLKKDGEVVRIGEGKNIATRLKEHLEKHGAEIDTFDFEIVPNDSKREQEEKRLLGQFKASIGKLPKYNPISN